MRKRTVSFWLLLAVSLVMTSCGVGGTAQNTTHPDYRSMKDMVLDILKTDEAKKSVINMMKDESFKRSLIMDESTVRTALIQSISKPDNPQIKEAFKDPKFTSTLAKSMKNEHKALMKDLMKDPEYQKMMISIMRDPEFEKNMMELMRSSAYRKQTMQIMKEAMQSPLFQAEMMTLMTKATEDMMKPKTMKKGKKKSGSGEGGGNSQS
ncbi:spore germination lipoprotein GerD [Brevibacillus sp. WF146]|uniref:spore germination lipoprotein GerD n=1 Tax=Brevibacillus sp. WF146 TaxID=319501 RepID=UPI0007EC9410|nr:spore germination lipoprotein GerD [Brevibacillus sp. WF146]UYZ13448.1 spore germination lipoprotein GerD [Brevibacillus sp. WF146]